MINPGDLRCPIAITVQSTTPDAFGDLAQQWSEVCNTWAKIAPLTSKEVYALGSGFTEQATHKVTIRYRPDVAQGMRVVYRNSTYTIQQVQDPDNLRAELALICLEVTQ